MASPVRAVLAAFGVAILGTFLSLVASVPVVLVVGFGGIDTVPAFVALFVAAYVGYALAGLWYLRYSGRGFGFVDAHLPDRNDVVLILAGTVGVFFALAAISSIVQALGLPTTPHNLFEPGFDPTLLLVLVPLVLLVNAPVEEFLFRNVIQKALYDSFSRLHAVVLTSLIFALVHVPVYYNPNLLATATSLVVIFVGSCVFGFVYAETDNLVVPSVVHGLFNAIQIALFYVVVTGQETLAALV